MKSHLNEYFRTIKRIASVVFAVGVCSYLPAAISATGGAPAYQVQTIPFNWIDATQATKQATQTLIPIGFNFNYYGVTYERLAIRGGDLILGTFDPDAPFSQVTAISPHLDWYLYAYPLSEPGRGVYTKLEGSAPNRQFTVSWIDASFVEYLPCEDEYCPTALFGKVSFQATLYEGSNDIVFRYLDLIASDEAGAGYTNHDNRATARVSVGNTGSTEGTLYLPSITSRTALRFFIGSPANLSPIADAGPDIVVNQRDTGILNGSRSSDAGGAVASYAWQGDGIPIANPNDAIANFTAPLVPVDTVRSATLTVTDNLGAYSVDKTNVTIRNIDINQPPIANAGTDQTVNEGDRVRLTGTGTDPEGYVVTYKWTQIAGPAVRFISPPGDTESYANFDTPAVPEDTVLTFQLTVTDLRNGTGSDAVNVKVLAAPNKPPLAVTVPSFTVKQKTIVSLDGSKSYDPDGSVVSYRWKQVAGKAVTLKNATSAVATFTAPGTNTNLPLTFELTVTDNNGATGTSQVIVVVARRL